MSIVSLFQKKNEPIHGFIGYYHLADWWMSEFNDLERVYIISGYSPMGSSGESLIKGNITFSSHSVILFLSFLSGYFNTKRDRAIAIRILNKAENLISEKILDMDLHILYSHVIQIHYSNRNNDPRSFEKAIEGCEKQIKIAPRVAKIFKKESPDGFMPRHVGYQQLAIIKEKEKKYQEVIEICTKAQSEGWRGDWQKRIDHCILKLH